MKNSGRTRRWRIAAACLSFVMTFGMMYALYWRKGLVPFGERTLMIFDANWQYLDFFSYLKDALAGKNSLLYTFSKGLGDSGIALFAYYLASPLNLLVVFFEKGDIHAFFALICALKLALAGAFFACFLSARFYPRRFGPREGLIVVMLSVSYALGQYSIAQASNIMWLDGVYMLPLIMLGAWRTARGGGLWRLAVPVGLAILFNWYSAGADCVFAIIYFLFELVVFLWEREGSKDWRYALTALVRFAAAMAIGVMISAVLFLPTIMSLMGTSKGGFNLRELLDLSLNGNPLSAALGFIPGSESDLGEVALCCGSVALIGAVGLFMLKTLPRWRKNACIALVIIGLAIFYFNPLVILFSLLKRFYSYWYRYSYVGIAIVAYLAAAFFSHTETRSREKAAIAIRAMALILLAGFAMCLIKKSSFDAFNRALRWYAFAGVALVLFLYRPRKRALRVLTAALCLMAFAADAAYNVALLMDIYSDTFVESYQSYSVANQRQIEGITAADEGPYRIVQTFTRTMKNQNTAMYNEPIGNGYWSNVIYASTVDERQMRFMERLGYPEWADTLNVANTCQLGADSLLSVKYVLSKYEINGLTRADLPDGVKGKHTYVNPYCLPFAFRYADTGGACDDENPFVYQNALYSRLLGEDVELYVPLEFKSTAYDEEKGTPYSYTITIPKGEYAVYGNLPWEHTYSGFLDLNGKQRSYYAAWLCPDVFYIPTQIGDTQAYVSISTKEPENVTMGNEQFYALDLKAFERVTDALSARAAEAISVENGRAEFTVKAAKAGERLFVSIPYNAGWSVTRNGEKLKIDPAVDVFEDCLYAIPLQEGENTIRMVYHVPHMKLYALISALGVALLIAIGLWPARRRQRARR